MYKNFKRIIIFLIPFQFLIFNILSYCHDYKDLVKGNLILFNDNWAWCWYQDERAVVDIKNSKIIFDLSETWAYGGQLSTNANIGYNNGYFNYCTNGVDRIDFICTDYHPRDYNTSIFHGYIFKGKTYRSDGIEIDNNIFDALNLPSTDKMTTVFTANTNINGDIMRSCWNTDVYRYYDGTIATIITVHVNGNNEGSSTLINPDHNFIYCQFNSSEWKYHYLANTGFKMYASEQEYTGFGVIYPDDPNTIYISTVYDPHDSANLGVHEIFKGVTSDNGITWNWTPVTQKSVRDNFRPIVPVWDKDNTALFWWRGTYNSSQTYDAAIVGIIERKKEIAGLMKYIDASTENTTFLDGSTLVTTGPDNTMGPSDVKWHTRTNYGNGGSVLTSSESGVENAPALKTKITGLKSGIYDVWVNFGANPLYDWRIKSGLNLNDMQLFRQMACKQVEQGDHDANLILTGGGNTCLYQGYIGRVQLLSDNSYIDVFIDDSAVRAGSSSALVGDIVRTWYDGLSIARIEKSVNITKMETLSVETRLYQNYPNPFNPTTRISYLIPKAEFITLKVFDLLGREIQTLVNGYLQPGKYSVDFIPNSIATGMYYYSLKTGNNYLVIKKMLFLK